MCTVHSKRKQFCLLISNLAIFYFLRIRGGIRLWNDIWYILEDSGVTDEVRVNHG